jgi:hypothetical protein
MQNKDNYLGSATPPNRPTRGAPPKPLFPHTARLSQVDYSTLCEGGKRPRDQMAEHRDGVPPVGNAG